MNKLKELDNRALAIPIVFALALFCVLGLAIAPMLHMAPKNVPVAIVNLDKGADLPSGEHLVAGDLVEDKIQEMIAENADSGESPMKFVSLSSRQELDENIADYYGAIVIPADFTEKQLAGNVALASTLGTGLQELMASQQQAAAPDAAALAAQASPEDLEAMQQQAQAAMAESVQGIIQDAVSAQQNAEKPTIELVVNTVKSPIFANTMRSSMASTLAGAGVNVEITSIGEAGEDANPLGGIMGVQMAVMPLMMLSLIMSLIAFVVTSAQDTERTRASKGRRAAIQVGYAVVASLVAALAAYGIVAWLGGLDVPARAILLLWLASFCIMLANLGLLSISIPLGALVMVCVFALGMGTAILPPEMLPTFWADWVYPWAPQVSIGNGLRSIIYLGSGPFDAGVARLIAWGCVGLVALAVGVFIPSHKKTA